MATELLELQLEELSLVDRPANQEAMVTLVKRADPDQKEPNMEKEMEELKAEVEALKAAATEAEEAHEKLKSENEMLRKGLIENGFKITAEEITKADAEPEYIEIEGEKIAKSDVPAPILKKLEEAELEKADRELTKAAEEKLPHFAKDAAKAILKAVDGMDEIDMIMEALAAADQAFADKMEELGKADPVDDLTSPKEKFDALLAEYMEVENLGKSDYHKAYAHVAKTKEGKALIAKTYKANKE